MSVLSIARNKSFLGLLGANTILGAAMPMLIILGGLSGFMLAPTPTLATIPASLQTLASLFASAPFSLFMGRFGRKAGFAFGAGLAILGGLLGLAALVTGSFALLCIAHLVFGAALSCYQYFRFAAADAVSSDWQPVAISLMLTSGLIAAFVGPELFVMTKNALAPTPLAGAYGAIAVLSLIGMLPLAFVNIPAHALGKKRPPFLSSLSVLKERSIRNAVGLGAISQGIMVFLMIPTPLAMIGCGFSEEVSGDVIRWHVVAMFAPSFFTGFLIKRFGAKPIATFGIGLLIIAALVAAAGLTAPHFYGSLILLGVGWNFGFIGATSMLAAAVPDDMKSVVQGVNDTLIALVSTICAFAAGALVAGFGWIVLAYIAAAILGLTLCATLLSGRSTT
ncbi:MFS transporter [Planktotalea sp.]|uniref:MFS transporter n=1 Tax=Planktotalea sp. TaxID=2029877 RepID=UPI003298CCB1